MLRHKPNWLVAICMFLLLGLTGCWEQWSETWFPLMKWQKVVQGFEEATLHGERVEFLPPEGSVPTDGGEAQVNRLDLAKADALVNPRDPGDFRSVANGAEQYAIYCEVCHGTTGMGDGPVSMTGSKAGPFAGVFPLVGITRGRSDGYIYLTIRNGGIRMPHYNRIPQMDRWDIVNYVRFLDKKGGKP